MARRQSIVCSAHVLSLFVSQKLGTFASSENAADLEALRDLLESGQVAPAIDQTFALSDVPAAMRAMIDGTIQGKVVITL